MKKNCKNILLAIMLLGVGSMLSTTANAKVCFVGDEDCTGAADFGDHQDPYEDGKSCEAEGYVLRSECNDPSKHITGYCPYNSSYVMCCGNEYVYDACVYPHVTVDKCGSKFKCKCDPEVYKYTDQTCPTQFAFSNPGGTACTQIDAGTTETTKTILYSACLCDRGLYPYGKEDCQTSANADVNGDPCSDSQGNQYWNSCKCDSKKYPYEALDCEFGGKGEGCVQGGIYFYEQCCSCAAYPAEGERGGDPNDPHATEAEACDCPRKGRFHINQCEEGWQPNSDGSACERISCENAVKLFFSKPENIKLYPSYAVFTGDKLVNYAQLTDAEKNKLPLAERTYAVGAAVENHNASYGVLAGNVTVSSKYCSTSTQYVDGKRVTVGGTQLGCTKASTIYSGAYFGSLGTTPDHVMLQEACGTNDPSKTVVPTIKFTGSTFPNTNGTSYSTTIYSSELNFSGTTTVNSNIYLYNGKLSGSGATFKKYVNLTVNNSYPNVNNAVFTMSSATFKNTLNSSGYAYNAGTIKFEVPSTYKSSVVGSFTLSEGQKFRASTVYLYPETDTYVFHNRDNGNRFPSASSWTASLKFTGPSSATAANVYTSLYVGMDSSYSPKKRARGMYVNLSGNLNWNMYEGSTKKTLGLSSASSLKSTDYGRGNYAKLVFGNGVYKQQCYMKSSIYYIVNRKSGMSCATKSWIEDSIYYAACSLTSTDSLSSISAMGEMSCNRTRKCGCRSTYFRTGCKIEYSYHDGGEDNTNQGPVLLCI